MKLCNLRKKDVSFKPDGSIENCYLMVDSSYFKRREAISFNTQGLNGQEFIGFAGWDSTDNCQPFINAFIKWVKEF